MQGEYADIINGTPNKSQKEIGLERIYLIRSEDEIVENTDMLHLIGRTLVDASFFKFVSKLPKLLETYQVK